MHTVLHATTGLLCAIASLLLIGGRRMKPGVIMMLVVLAVIVIGIVAVLWSQGGLRGGLW